MANANLTVDIANGFYVSDSKPLANQRCVNLYPNIPERPSASPTALFGVSGLERVVTTGYRVSDRNRGGWVFNGIPYVVNGQSLYRINKAVNFDGTFSYSVTRLGFIAGEALCSFSDNGQQLIILNGSGTGYIFQSEPTDLLQQIVDAGFTANGIPEQVTFVNSYFIVTTSDNVAIISAPNDGLSWNALDVISAEADPDGVIAPFVFKNQLYLLGTQTTQGYDNIGGAGVPFQSSGFVLAQGCVAPFSVRNVGNAVLWVGGGKNEKAAIWLFTGAEPQKISTIAIDNVLATLSEADLTAISGWSYSERGHNFVAFNTPRTTYVYDVRTDRWHERESELINTKGEKLIERCRIQCVLNAFNELLVGDTQDGRVGRLNFETYTEYDNVLSAFFTTSPLYDQSHSFTLPSIELFCETGVGNADDRDPTVRMDISRDGVNFEYPRTRSLGARGARNVRVIWYKNGRFPNTGIMRFTISGPVKRRLYSVEVNFKRNVRRG